MLFIHAINFKSNSGELHVRELRAVEDGFNLFVVQQFAKPSVQET